MIYFLYFIAFLFSVLTLLNLALIVFIGFKAPFREFIKTLQILIKYYIMSLVSFPITLAGLGLASVLPLLATPQNGWCDNHSYEAVEPRLPSWLSWFMTPDNSLLGDRTFYLESMGKSSYWSQVRWLMRNPAYSFGLKYIVRGSDPVVIYGDQTIKDNDNAKAGWCLVKAGGLFQLTYVKQVFNTTRCIYVNFGWNIRGYVDPNVVPVDVYEATFVFSPRLSGFR